MDRTRSKQQVVSFWENSTGQVKSLLWKASGSTRLRQYWEYLLSDGAHADTQRSQDYVVSFDNERSSWSFLHSTWRVRGQCFCAGSGSVHAWLSWANWLLEARKENKKEISEKKESFQIKKGSSWTKECWRRLIFGVRGCSYNTSRKKIINPTIFCQRQALFTM